MKKNTVLPFFFFVLSLLSVSSVHAQIDFGDVEIGSSVQKTFMIWNKGTVADTGIEVQAGAPFFVDSPKSRFSILPGDSIAVYISFKPIRVGSVNMEIFLYKPNSGWTPSISLTGNGIAQNAVEQTGRPSFALLNCFPNPTNKFVNVVYSLDRRSLVKIEILNLLGEKIHTVYDGTEDGGIHTLHFDTESLTPGSYLICLINNELHLTKRLEVIR